MKNIFKVFKMSDWLLWISIVLFCMGIFCFPETHSYEWNLPKLSMNAYVLFVFFSFFLGGTRNIKGFTGNLFTAMYCDLIFLWSVYSLGLNILTPTIIATAAMIILSTAFAINRFGGDELVEGSRNKLFEMIEGTDRYLKEPSYKDGITISNLREVAEYLHTHKIDIQEHEVKRCIDMLDGYIPKAQKDDIRTIFEIEELLKALIKSKKQ